MPNATPGFVYQITAFGGVIGQETINVWYFGGANICTDLVALGNDFITLDLLPLLPVMSGSAGFSYITVTGVHGDIAFTSVPVSVTGGVSGDCLPPFVSWDFTLLRGGAGERNGYKRIAGVPESLQLQGSPTVGAAVNLAAAGASMFTSISDGTHSYAPVIRRTRVHHIPQSPPVWYNVSAIQFSKIGSQNSRKFGHGR